MKQVKNLNKIRIRRKARVRARIIGTAIKPRLSVFRSNKNVYVQLIDDVAQKTLASASTYNTKTKGTKSDLAKEVGDAIAKKAKELGIVSVILDRGSSKFHGRIKAIAEAAREGGLKL
ncbi:MAG: 50S ribosomal protein L18 [Patescibacteria group bacterium]